MERKRTLKEKCMIVGIIFLCAAAFAIFGVIIGGLITIGTGNYIYLLGGIALSGAIGGLLGFAISTENSSSYPYDGDPEWPWRLFKKESMKIYRDKLVKSFISILVVISKFAIGAIPGALAGFLVGHFFGELGICVSFLGMLGGYLSFSLVKHDIDIFIFAFAGTFVFAVFGAAFGGMLTLINDNNPDPLRYIIVLFAILGGFAGAMSPAYCRSILVDKNEDSSDA